jgi:hypothetical protein
MNDMLVRSIRVDRCVNGGLIWLWKHEEEGGRVADVRYLNEGRTVFVFIYKSKEDLCMKNTDLAISFHEFTGMSVVVHSDRT